VIGLHASQVRLALPVSGALVLGVGVGSAIGWMAGGADTVASPTAAASVTASGLASASVFHPTSVRRKQDATAVGLLRRAAVARTAMAWSGTQVVTTWSSDGTTSSMVDLSHEPGEGTAARVHPTEAGAADLTFVPDADGPEASVDDDGTGPLALLTHTYLLERGASQHVAGRMADQVLALRADGSVAARFWIDRATGLVLRRELVDPKGWVTHSTVFLDIRPGQAGDLVAGADITRPWTTEITDAQLETMRGAGWTCPDTLPGGLSLYDVRRTSSTTNPVIQLAYSDGLVNVSVFEERGHLDKAALKGYTPEKIAGRTVQVRRGTTAELTWQSGATVYTVLADAPEASVDAIAASLPAPSVASASSGWSRVRRGLNRMGSWVDPRG
jgi:sigma-E factor negative regulatory protein RseB